MFVYYILKEVFVDDMPLCLDLGNLTIIVKKSEPRLVFSLM